MVKHKNLNTKYHAKILLNFNKNKLKEFKCNYKKCDYTCKTKTYLDIHIISKHTKNYPYKCKLCNYKTARKYDFNRHLNTHSNRNKLSCKFCNYKSVNINYLKRHYKIKHKLI